MGKFSQFGGGVTGKFTRKIADKVPQPAFGRVQFGQGFPNAR